MIDAILPIALFGIATTVTPGPNNVMLTASGSAFGFQRSLPHIVGITLGFPLMVFLVGLGIGEVFTRYPQIHLALKYIGAAYLLYLAWRIAQAGRPDGGRMSGRPLTMVEAAAFQWVNPKAWMIAVSAIPAFTRARSEKWEPVFGKIERKNKELERDRRVDIKSSRSSIGGHYYAELALICAVFTVIALPSSVTWCLFGVGIRQLIRTPETARIINLILAALVALSIILLFV